MKIGFATNDWSGSVFDEKGNPVWGGSGWARLGQYVDRLPHEVVAGVLVGHPGKGQLGVREHSPKQDAKGNWTRNWNQGTDHFDCDVLVLQRVMFAGAADNIASARANGQIVINDLDDWYWGLSTNNAAFIASHPKFNPSENINHYKAVLNRSDAVIVSTPYLAERIKPFVRSDIAVLPNCVDFDRFTAREQQTVPTVGWAGSTSHRSGDLELLRGVASQIIREGFKLHHTGDIPQALKFADVVGVPVDQVSTLPLVRPEEYPSMLQFDIGLIPLTDVPFNLAKSNIKSLEYTAAGIPFIASRVGEYLRQKNETGAGRLVKNHGDWLKHIRQLADPETRHNEARSNYEALKHFDTMYGAARLNAFLESVS